MAMLVGFTFYQVDYKCLLSVGEFQTIPNATIKDQTAVETASTQTMSASAD